MPDRRGAGLAAALVAVLMAAAGCGLGLEQGARETRQASWVARLQTEAARPDEGRAGPDRARTCVESEEAAVARAIAASPEAARFSGQARYLEAQAEASFADAPELRLSDLRADRLVGGPERAELALRVPIARPGTLDGERRLLVAEAGVAAARAQLERVGLAYGVREAWARLSHAHIQAALAADAVEVVGRQTGAVAATGELSAVDRQTLSAQKLRAEAELALANGEVSRWHEAVTALTGTPVCAAVKSVALESVSADAKEALAQRAELSRLFAEREHATVARALAERQAWPWFEWVQVGYEVDRGFFPDTFGFALAVTLPFGTWDGAAADAERVRLRAIDDEARLWVARIEGEVGSVARELEARLGEVARLEALAAALPDEAIEKLRTAAPTEVLESDVAGLYRERARMMRAVAEARLAAWLTRARLLSALGR